MKYVFYMLFLSLFIMSCEDDLNSPNADPPNLPGCTDMTACNYDPVANTNNGSCIFDQTECDAFDLCEEENWVHHTCIDIADDSDVPNWNGSETNCLLIHTFGEDNTCQDVYGNDYLNWDTTVDGCNDGHQYTAGNCDDGGDDG